MPAAAESLPALLATGAALGWNVAWVPGPINAEILRRGIARGYGSSFLVGAGASSADFLWALAVAAGVGLVAGSPAVRTALAVASGLLLAALGVVFLRGAWRSARTPAGPRPPAPPSRFETGRGGFALGFLMAALSPWNLAFWTAVVGQQAARGAGGGRAVLFAAAVVAGALAWCAVLCTAVRLGARFASPAWEVGTRAVTGLLMLGFAARTAAAMFGPGAGGG